MASAIAELASTSTVITVGEKILMIQRRLFDADLRRQFIGEVVAVDGQAARIRGYAFVFNSGIGTYERKPELRLRVVGVTDPFLHILVLPATADLERIGYVVEKGKLLISDGRGFRLDMNEFGLRR